MICVARDVADSARLALFRPQLAAAAARLGLSAKDFADLYFYSKPDPPALSFAAAYQTFLRKPRRDCGGGDALTAASASPLLSPRTAAVPTPRRDAVECDELFNLLRRDYGTPDVRRVA
jgi:hypothetical protein